jgi:hypothetical protein
MARLDLTNLSNCVLSLAQVLLRALLMAFGILLSLIEYFSISLSILDMIMTWVIFVSP